MHTRDSGWEEIGGREAAEKHIQEIRTSRGLGGKSVPKELIEILEQSCKILANQLYEGPTHFLLELIQNANDNKFNDADPTMIFTYKNGNIQIQCNETGFNPGNVTAICSLGSSSKKSKKRADDSIIYVGEKGIGFKSVFRVADVVWVSSRAYNFKFDSQTPLGMITPTTERFPVSKLPGWTSFYLRLKSDRDGTSIEPKIRTELENFDVRLLLFLQRLRTIKIQIFDDIGRMRSFQYNKAESAWGKDQTINLTDGKTTTSYLIHKRKLTALPHEDRREGVSSCEVVLAFPVDQDKVPVIVQQRVFAFLPIQDFGFRVILQADFLLTANREGVETSNDWNETLRDGFIHAFEDAAMHFNQTSLQYTWVRYITELSNSNGFFEILKRGIRDALLVKPVLRAWNEAPLRPDMAIFIPEKFRDHNGIPLTLNSSKENHYLSKNYNDADFKYLNNLGVREMSIDEFLADLRLLLRDYFAEFTKKTLEWQSRLAGVLTNILLSRSIWCLRSLPLVELRTGKWVSLVAETAFFPGERDRKVPGGIEMRIVDPKASQDLARRQLYTKLGVTDIENSVVQEKIVQLHKSWATHPTISSSDLIAQAQFLFSTLWVNNDDSPIWVVTEKGRFVKGSEVYLDSNGHLTASKVFEETRASFNFIHSDYRSAHKDSQESWVQWIMRHVGVSKIPRLVLNSSPFKLSEDFKFLVKSSPSERWLQILCVHWTEYETWLKAKEMDGETSGEVDGEISPVQTDDGPSDHERLISELREIEVTCRDKRRYRLQETYLPFDEFTSATNGKGPLLRIPDPEDTRWQHLGLFGVGVKNDFKFYLHWLSEIAGSSSVKRGEVNNLLRQIQARCKTEDEEQVKKYFLDSAKKLIFVPDPKPVPTKDSTSERLSPLQPPTHWQVLGSSSTQPPPKHKIISQLARPQDSDSHLDEANDDTELQKGSWYHASQFLWSGPKYFRVNRSLSALYLENERLFKHILGLSKVNLSHFVAEAYSFSLNDLSSHESLSYISKIIAALNNYMLNHYWRDGYTERYAYYRELQSLKIWPVSTNPDELPKEMRTASASDEWFIADRWDLEEIFCRSVPLFAFNSDQQWNMNKVFEQLNLTSRFLSVASKTTIKYEGRVKLSPQYSERIRMKVPFLIRIVNSDENHNNTWRRACLENIEVYIVDTIVKRHTVLYNNAYIDGELRQTDAYVERESEKLKMYVVGLYLESDKILDELVTSLGSALEMTSNRWLRLFQFVLGNDNEGKISKFLDKEKIPRSSNVKEDYDWGTEETHEGHGSGSSSGGARSSNGILFKVISSDNFHEFSSSFHMAGRNGVWVVTAEDGFDSSEMSKQLAELGFRIILPPGGPQQTSGALEAPVEGEEEEDENLQFLGEHELSLKFEKGFPGLYKPEEHWTSVHRSKAGYTEYQPVDGKYGSPFTFPDDADHKFAKILAKQYNRNPQSLWPRFPKKWHLEVKASYGALSDEFSLTWEQFERTRKLSYLRRGSLQTMPTEAVVLVRIYDVGQNPKVAFFAEPWKLYTEDKIEFRCKGSVKGQPVNVEDPS